MIIIALLLGIYADSRVLTYRICVAKRNRTVFQLLELMAVLQLLFAYKNGVFSFTRT